ncbi:MAG: lysophospholipase [Actinomycetota bacterium]|nr:lysophospholipase [Actinomycetota bacterium]
MKSENGFLDGAGGRRIFWQAWRPDAEARAVVVIVHGMSEHSSRYDHVAAALVDDGYAVYGVDHRGHGRSDGPRALIDRMSSVVADVHQLVLQARERHPGLPVFMLGHSMGGTISLLYTERHQGRLTGLMLSGPLAALDAAPAPLRLLSRALSVVAPKLPLVAIDSADISRDPAVVSAYDADPLVHRGKIPARTVTELAGPIDEFPTSVAAITIPTLILYGTADALAPPAGSQMLAERIGAQDKTVKAYEGLYHEILNEPEQAEVLADMRAWLSEHVAAPMSGRPATTPSAGAGSASADPSTS